MATMRFDAASLFDYLKNDHLEMTRLMEDVLISVDENNEKLMLRLYDDLMRHMWLEERYFYPELEQQGVTHELIRVALLQHEEIKRVLQEVFPLDPHSEEWLEEFQKLQELHEIHVEEEEQEVFPQAKNFLSPQDLGRIFTDIHTEVGKGSPLQQQRRTRRQRAPRIQV